MESYSICICTPEDVVNVKGGTGSYVAGLGAALVRKGHDVYVLTRYRGGEIEEEIQGMHVERVVAKGPPVLYVPSYLYKCLGKILAKENINLLHENLPLMSTLFCKKSWFRKPRITTVHTTFRGEFNALKKLRPSSLNFSDFTLPILNPIIGFAERKTLLRSSRIIAVSDTAKMEVARYYDIDGRKITLIYNGVDTRKFSPGVNTLDIQETTGITASKFILYLGRLSPLKNVRDLLIAFHSLLEKGRDVGLAIVGQMTKHGYFLVDLTKKLDISNKVSFLGYVPENETPMYYSAADIYVLPSIYESHPLTLLEAMSCGKPVVTTKTVAFPGMKTEETGILVEPGNPRELATAMDVLLRDDNLAARIGRNARSLVESRYSWERIADQTIDVYEEALS